MDENYFDKKLKDILESPPSFEPDANAMLLMQQRLRAAQSPSKRRGIWPWLLSLLFLLFLLGGGALYSKQKALNSALTALNKQLTLITQDTVIEKQIIHHFDTIYTTVYIEKYIGLTRPNLIQDWSESSLADYSYSNPIFSYSGYSRKGLLSWSLGKRLISLLDERPDSSFLDQESSKLTAVPLPDPFAEVLSPIDRLLFGELTRLNATNTLSAKEEGLSPLAISEKGVNPLYYFTPTGFKGQFHFMPLLLPSHGLGGTSYALGTALEIELPQDRTLELGAEWLGMNFEAKDPAEFASFPIVAPTDPSDVLHELKGALSYLQLSATIRQVLFPKHRWKPHISAGFVAYRPLRQILTYEYLNGAGEYKLRSVLKGGSFLTPNFRMGLGTEIPLSKKMNLLNSIHYQHDFSNDATPFFALQYWALNLGVNYNFSNK